MTAAKKPARGKKAPPAKAKSQSRAEVAAEICERLAMGDSLRKACAANGGPDPATILRWAESEPFAQQYAQARARGYQMLADEIIEISDDSAGDVVTDEDGNARTDAERVARSKLRVDSRKWMLSKMLPKIYGDKIEANLTGEIGIRSIERRIIDAKE